MSPGFRFTQESRMPKAIASVKLVDTRKTQDPSKPHVSQLPSESTINNGHGARWYVGKRHPDSGKPVYYYPDVWERFSAEDKLRAIDHSPVVKDDTKLRAAELEEAFNAAGPLAQQGLVDRLLPALLDRLTAASPPNDGKGKRS